MSSISVFTVVELTDTAASKSDAESKAESVSPAPKRSQSMYKLINTFLTLRRPDCIVILIAKGLKAKAKRGSKCEPIGYYLCVVKLKL
jgi:hypothetical protein